MESQELKRIRLLLAYIGVVICLSFFESFFNTDTQLGFILHVARGALVLVYMVNFLVKIVVD